MTQLAALEDFGLFLVLTDKTLVAYHLDAIPPATDALIANDDLKRAPQKLSGSRDVGFFANGKMKDRALVFYKKRDGISSTFKVRCHRHRHTHIHSRDGTNTAFP